jgi:hypothetical protein
MKAAAAAVDGGVRAKAGAELAMTIPARRDGSIARQLT